MVLTLTVEQPLRSQIYTAVLILTGWIISPANNPAQDGFFLILRTNIHLLHNIAEPQNTGTMQPLSKDPLSALNILQVMIDIRVMPSAVMIEYQCKPADLLQIDNAVEILVTDNLIAGLWIGTLNLCRILAKAIL